MSHHLSPISRRALLRRAGALGFAGPAMGALGLNLAAMGQASAANATGYKALVCIFMYGGNDAYNTVLATDAASWSAYGTARAISDASGIALAAPGTPASGTTLHARLGGVLPINPANAQAGRSFALHPVMGSVRDMFAARRVAVVANVGPLSGPTTKVAYQNGTAPRPPKLFSHNDQQSFWQSFATEGASNGWGGRMADLLMGSNTNSMFSAMSLTGNAVWLSGRQAKPFQMAPSGAIRIGTPDGLLFGSAVAQEKMRALMRSTRDNQVLERDHAAVSSRSMDAEAILSKYLPTTSGGPWGSAADPLADPLLKYKDPLTGLMTVNPLAQQLQAVARTIAARQTLGMARQVFFVSMPDFDTHDAQNETQAKNLAMLAQGMSYFDKTLTAMGVDQSVTTFTASDFGRTFASNGDGTDHGWGGHHFVMGGAVKGGDIYGRFPDYGLADAVGTFSSNDQLAGGVLLPAQAAANYAATMGKWLGLSDSELESIMPAVKPWTVAQRNLGFMA